MNIDKIRKALNADDWCEAMADLGYKIIAFDEDNAGWGIFTDEFKERMIYADKDEGYFITYMQITKYAFDEREELK